MNCFSFSHDGVGQEGPSWATPLFQTLGVTRGHSAAPWGDFAPLLGPAAGTPGGAAQLDWWPCACGWWSHGNRTLDGSSGLLAGIPVIGSGSGLSQGRSLRTICGSQSSESPQTQGVETPGPPRTTTTRMHIVDVGPGQGCEFMATGPPPGGCKVTSGSGLWEAGFSGWAPLSPPESGLRVTRASHLA